MGTLLRIPGIINQAEHSVEMYHKDLLLNDKAEELYIAILAAFEGAIEWLQQHPIGRLVDHLLRCSD
jgi:hypothetical protein